VNAVRHAVAHGRVQGVGYRAFVADAAIGRGLAGWVRNRRDGTVEALFSGAADAVEDVIAACRRGPYGARVDRIDLRDATAQDIALRGQGTAFAVLPTV
jgi:acylphosphatase